MGCSPVIQCVESEVGNISETLHSMGQTKPKNKVLANQLLTGVERQVGCVTAAFEAASNFSSCCMSVKTAAKCNLRQTLGERSLVTKIVRDKGTPKMFWQILNFIHGIFLVFFFFFADGRSPEMRGKPHLGSMTSQI